MKYCFFICILLIFSFINSSAHKEDSYCGFNVGDTLKILDNKEDYNLRVLIFTDLSACDIYNSNIATITNNLEGNNIQFIIIIEGVNESNVKSAQNAYGWKGKILTDEFGVYGKFYKIQNFPAILVLNNDGVLLAKGKAGGGIINSKFIKELFIKEKKKDKNSKLYSFIKEVSRYKIIKDSAAILAKRYLKATFDTKHQNYYFKQIGNCSIDILNTNGVIINVITKKNYSSYNCFQGCFNFSWVIQDSILFLYYLNNYFEPKFQYFNVSNDSLYNETSIDFQRESFRNGNSDVATYIPQNNNFLLILSHRRRENDSGSTINLDQNLIFVYNNQGKLINQFDTPDDYWTKYKSSTWFDEVINYNNNYIITLQFFSNKLKFWDFNYKLLKTINLPLGKYFRETTIDLDELDHEKEPEKLTNAFNLISYFDNILINNKNQILLVLRNENIPNGATSFFAPERTTDIYLYIIDENGKNLVEPFSLKNNYPFYFDNQVIKALEIQKDNSIDIVTYEYYLDK